MNTVSIEQWKSMFSQIGLSQSDMDKWHKVFEKDNPQGHQSFLEWLIPDDKGLIKAIRDQSR